MIYRMQRKKAISRFSRWTIVYWVIFNNRLSNPCIVPVSFRRLRLPDLKTIGT
jgi:hypothetical protein